MSVPTHHVDDLEVAAKIRARGWNRDEEQVIFAVLCGESNLNAWAVNLVVKDTEDPDADLRAHLSLDLGIAQFNTYWYGEVISPQDSMDVDRALDAVYARCPTGDLGPLLDWAAFRRGTFVRHVPRAAAAFEQLS